MQEIFIDFFIYQFHTAYSRVAIYIYICIRVYISLDALYILLVFSEPLGREVRRKETEEIEGNSQNMTI